MIYDEGENNIEEEIKNLLVQLESDLREGIDESLVLGPNQYSTKERTFRGGIIINQAEFEVLPKEISDLLHESRRDKIIPEHERMRFDYPVKSVLSSCQRDYLQELDCVVDVGKPVVADLEGK